MQLSKELLEKIAINYPDKILIEPVKQSFPQDKYLGFVYLVKGNDSWEQLFYFIYKFFDTQQECIKYHEDLLELIKTDYYTNLNKSIL